jgi:hypothetical protein
MIPKYNAQMKFKNSLLCSLMVFLLMLLLLIATKVDSYSWDEPTTDVEYRLRGIWVTMGWVLAIGASLVTFIFLMLLGWLRTALVCVFNYLSKSAT